MLMIGFVTATATNKGLMKRLSFVDVDVSLMFHFVTSTRLEYMEG